MPNSVSLSALTPRRFTQLSGMAVSSLAMSGAARAAAAPDVALDYAVHPGGFAETSHMDRCLQRPDSGAVVPDA
jgi:hypothetical protein